AKMYALEFLALQHTRQLIWVNKWRSDNLEGAGRAAALRYICSLNEHASGIYRCSIDRGHIGRGRDPRQTGPGVPHRPFPAVHPDDFEIAPDAEFLVEQQRQLAHRHPVAHRYREHSNKGGKTRLEYVSLDLHAVNRIGPVENDEPLAALACGLHCQGHRIYESVHPSSDILDIEHKHIHLAEHVA